MNIPSWEQDVRLSNAITRLQEAAKRDSRLTGIVERITPHEVWHGDQDWRLILLDMLAIVVAGQSGIEDSDLSLQPVVQPAPEPEPVIEVDPNRPPQQPGALLDEGYIKRHKKRVGPAAGRYTKEQMRAAFPEVYDPAYGFREGRDKG